MIKFQLFLKESVLFVLALLLGLATAYSYNIIQEGEPLVVPVSVSFIEIITAIAIASVFMFFVIRFRRMAGFSFKIFLFILIFFGSQAVGGAFFAFPFDLVFVLLILFLYQAGHNILSHNVAIAVAIGGISALFGGTVSPLMAVLLLAVLSIYDIVAVYLTRHMIALARGMIESGAVFGFIIPLEWKGFLESKREARIGEKFMVLGSGDIGLPLILVASLVGQSLGAALIVAVFSLFGLFITHILFVTQDSRKPMAALPPIATMTIIGYLLSLLIRI